MKIYAPKAKRVVRSFSSVMIAIAASANSFIFYLHIVANFEFAFRHWRFLEKNNFLRKLELLQTLGGSLEGRKFLRLTPPVGFWEGNVSCGICWRGISEIVV